MDRPAPFFQKRNNTRVVVRNRNSFTRSPTRTTHAITSSEVTAEPQKNIRKTVRRKITRSPITRTTAATKTTSKKIEKTTTSETTRLPSPTKIQTTTKIAATTEIPSTIPPDYEKFSEEFSDDIASVLPALTSAKPRKPSTTFIEATTRALKQVQPKWEFEPKEERKQSSFDEILEQQYKIKGIDISSEENYEDEKLIGVLGSQVCLTELFPI